MLGGPRPLPSQPVRTQPSGVQARPGMPGSRPPTGPSRPPMGQQQYRRQRRRSPHRHRLRRSPAPLRSPKA
jgi:hypothetical protein